jgi:hypothetical protein
MQPDTTPPDSLELLAMFETAAAIAAAAYAEEEAAYELQRAKEAPYFIPTSNR